MASSSIIHQANEDQTHLSMMAWRVHRQSLGGTSPPSEGPDHPAA
jgi:hypothetical protein